MRFKKIMIKLTEHSLINVFLSNKNHKKNLKEKEVKYFHKNKFQLYTRIPWEPVILQRAELVIHCHHFNDRINIYNAY
jgi:hypothetical protein